MTGPKNAKSDFDDAALFDALDVQRRDRGLGIWISSQFVPSESVNWREISIALIDLRLGGVHCRQERRKPAIPRSTTAMLTSRSQ